MRLYCGPPSGRAASVLRGRRGRLAVVSSKTRRAFVCRNTLDSCNNTTCANTFNAPHISLSRRTRGASCVKTVELRSVLRHIVTLRRDCRLRANLCARHLSTERDLWRSSHCLSLHPNYKQTKRNQTNRHTTPAPS